MNKPNLIKHKGLNIFQSLLLILSMAFLLGYLAWLIGGKLFAVLALIFILMGYLFNPILSPKLILGMCRCKLLTYYEAPQLYSIIQTLAERAELDTMPRLFYIPSDVMNAFAVGVRRNAAIALSDGLLRRLSLHEIAGVMAHEISHIKHNDVRVMGFADLTSRLTYFLSLIGQFLLFLNLPLLLFHDYTISWTAIVILLSAPTVSALIQLALSRTREYNADLGAAQLLGDPEALANALGKMEQYQGRILERILWPRQRIPEPSLLRTHPPTEERIRRLLELKEKKKEREDQWKPMFDVYDEYPIKRLSRSPIKPRWHITGVWF